MNKRYILTLLIGIISLSLFANNDELKVLSRYNYYTTESNTEILVFLPEKIAGLKEQSCTIELKFNEQKTSFESPVQKIIRIPIPIESLVEGKTTGNCVIRLKDNNLEKTFEITKYPATDNEVKIDHLNGGLIVDHAPYFPFGFYAYSPVQPTLAEEEVVKGFNMMSPYQKIEGKTIKQRREYMDRCAELGMKVHYQLLSIAGGGGVGSSSNKSLSEQQKHQQLIEEINEFKNHPALLAWYISDEPVGQDVSAKPLEEIYNLIKQVDPYHPVSIVFMTPRKALDYKNAMDIVMADPYPIPNASVMEVKEVCEHLHRDFYPEKPVWIIPQAFGGNEWWMREPTPAEMRLMTYLAIMEHATGIQYFIRHGLNSFPKSVIAWNECGAVATEVQMLKPYLLSEEAQPIINNTDKDFKFKAYKYEDHILVLAINLITKPKHFEIHIDHENLSASAYLIFENRKVSLREGMMQDIVDALGTRAYLIPLRTDKENKDFVHKTNLTTNPGFEIVTVAGVPAGCYAKTKGDRGSTYFIDSQEKKEGKYSIRFTTPKANQGMNLSFYPVPVKGQKTYTVSVWAKAAKNDLLELNHYQRKGWLARLFSREPQIKPKEFLLSFAGKSKTFELSTEWKQYFLNVTIDTKTGSQQKHSPNLQLLSRATAWFDVLQVVPDGNIMSRPTNEGIEIILESTNADAEIRYTDNGTEVDMSSKKYTSPFVLQNDATVQMKLFVDGQEQGFSSQDFFLHKAIGQKVNYWTRFSKSYNAGGETGLFNGIKATETYNDGKWQGYLAKDLDLIIDFEKQTEISEITANFLQDTKTWIFLPKSFEILISADGKEFKSIKEIDNITPNDKKGAFIQTFNAKFNPVKTRFLRIKGHSIKDCPKWHPGAGKAAWLFVDEIIVK
ncbi:MAG: discoidin domain-containing protein [Bacteroidales bacterium]|nr:discoidin domain-containing protein [Bacteroidales bacterium]